MKRTLCALQIHHHRIYVMYLGNRSCFYQNQSCRHQAQRYRESRYPSRTGATLAEAPNIFIGLTALRTTRHDRRLSAALAMGGQALGRDNQKENFFFLSKSINGFRLRDLRRAAIPPPFFFPPIFYLHMYMYLYE